MALRVGQDRGGFPVRLAEEAVGCAGNQPARRFAVLHQLQKRFQPIRGQGEIFPDGREVAPVWFFVRHAEHDQPADQRLGFLVPVGIAGLVRGIDHECVRQ